MGDWLVEEVLQYFLRIVLEPLPRLLQLVGDLVLQVPVVTDQAPVKFLMSRTLGIVQVGYVVLVTVAGIVAMTHGGLQSEYSAKALLQRAVLGFVAAHYTGWIVETSIGVANAVTGALLFRGSQPLDHMDSSKAITEQIAEAPESLLLLLILQFVVVALIVVLLIGWVSRLLSLVMLAGLGPLALACHGLPWLEPVALVWWRLLMGVLVTVVVQAALLQFGLQLLLDPLSNMSYSGAFDRSDVLTTLLLTVCLLLAVIRAPSMVGRFLPAAAGRSGGGAGTLGTMLRYRMLTRSFRSGERSTGLRSVLMRRLSSRYERLRPLRGRPKTTPTWGGIAGRIRRVTRPRGSGLRSWPTAVAATGAGKGTRLPGQNAAVRVRRAWTRRRALLAGHSVADLHRQATRVAGQDKGAQQQGAARLLQQRAGQPGQPGQGGGARLTPRPQAGRTAGNAGKSSIKHGRPSTRKGSRASRTGAGAPGTAGPRTPGRQGSAVSKPVPVTRRSATRPDAPKTVGRNQRSVNGGGTGQSAGHRSARPQRPLRPFRIQDQPPTRRPRTLRSRPAQSEDE